LDLIVFSALFSIHLLGTLVFFSCGLAFVVLAGSLYYNLVDCIHFDCGVLSVVSFFFFPKKKQTGKKHYIHLEKVFLESLGYSGEMRYIE
jgi:hypothetical protein